MKILYTITKGEIGGAQVHVAQLLESMRRDGHDVALMTTPGGFLEEKARSLGVTFYSNIYFANSFNPFRLIRALREIKKAIRQFSPDIVHTHSSFAGILTRLSLKGRIPTIFTAHSWAFTDGASTFRKIIAPISERIVSKWTTKIICVSEYDRDVALRYAIAPREKLTIVYNGVSEVSADKKEDFCISVGRLAYPKEFLLLLQSFKLAGSSKLFIVGAGPDEEIIKAEIARLGLSERITLLGALLPEETRNKIAQAKTFLLLSKHEGLPITILEALSSKTAVIASNVGGIPEELGEGAGILVQNDAESIASKIRLLEDENIRTMIAEKGYARFQKLFTREKFLDETKKIYAEVLAAKAPLIS